MKGFLYLLLVSFFTASLLSYTVKPGKPQILSTESYVSCFNAETREMFRQEASTMAFATLHENPYPFELKDPKGKRISFKTTDGNEGTAYFIKSKKKSDKYIFVLQEWWGLNDYVKQESDRLYEELENVNVMALDMYDGKVTDNRDSAMKLIQGAKTERLESIVKGALAFAGTDAKIYTIGWCFGGMWSLQTAILAGKQAEGCVMYYGRPENNLEKLKRLDTDVLGIFGNLDKSPSSEVVAQFEKDMAAAGKTLITKKYEAYHGFANPSNPAPVYNKEAADDAHKHAVAYFRERMK